MKRLTPYLALLDWGTAALRKWGGATVSYLAGTNSPALLEKPKRLDTVARIRDIHGGLMDGNPVAWGRPRVVRS